MASRAPQSCWVLMTCRHSKVATSHTLMVQPAVLYRRWPQMAMRCTGWLWPLSVCTHLHCAVSQTCQTHHTLAQPLREPAGRAVPCG